MDLPAAQPSDATNATRARCVVVGAGLNLCLGTGQILLFSFGVFVKPIVDNTGWSRTDVATAVLWGQLLVALVSPLTGLAVDRLGARRIALVAGPSLGVGVMLIGLMSTSARSFVFFFALAFLLGGAQIPVPYIKAVTNWYDEKLGLALGSAMLLSGLGVAFFPPLSAALINAFGWRHAYVALALLVWCVSIPSAALLIHEPIKEIEQGSDLAEDIGSHSRTAINGITLLQAVKIRTFWMLAISFYLISIVIGGGTHVLPIILSDHGLKAQQSAFIMTIVGVAMMITRFCFGAMLDRFDAVKLTALIFAGATLGCVVLSTGITTASVPTAAVLIGIALGAEVDALAYLTSSIFGRRHFGAVYGALMFCFSFGLGCGPALFAQMEKNTGTYHWAFVLAACMALAATFLILTAARTDCLGARQGANDRRLS